VLGFGKHQSQGRSDLEFGDGRDSSDGSEEIRLIKFRTINHRVAKEKAGLKLE
jgi:hypothetical protein